MSFPKANMRVKRRKVNRNYKHDMSRVVKTSPRKSPMAFHPAKDLNGMLENCKTIIGFWMQTPVKDYNPNAIKFAEELIQNIDIFLSTPPGE